MRGALANEAMPASTSELSERLYQLERMRAEVYEAALRVNEIADRIFGPVPQAVSVNKLEAAAHSLFGRLDESLQILDGNLGGLRSAISRLENI